MANTQTDSRSRSLRVLVVDDSPMVRRILTGILRDAGHRVIAEAGDGEEALRLMHDYEPDLVTLDLDMPIMDGFDVLREMRTFTEVPVLVVSGLPLSKEALISQTGATGAVDILNKTFPDSPINLSLFTAELAQAIRQLMQVRNSSGFSST